MRRGWFLLLALSIGLNAGLLYVAFSERTGEQASTSLRWQPPGSRGGGPGHPGAQPPRPSLEQQVRHHLRRMSEHLALDETQRATITTLLEQHLPLVLAQRERVHDARRQVAAWYAAPDMDPAHFRVLVQHLSVAQATLDSLAAEAILAEAMLLSPDQRQRYVAVTPWGRLGPPHRPPPPPHAPSGTRPHPPRDGRN